MLKTSFCCSFTRSIYAYQLLICRSYLGVLIHLIFLVRVEFSLLPPCWTGRDSRLFLKVLTAMFISSIKSPSMSFSTNFGISFRFWGNATLTV